MSCVRGRACAWGDGRPREVRGDLGSRLSVRPRRSRCTGCQVTHVLLPEVLWPRRSDAGEVIGAGLEIVALGRPDTGLDHHVGSECVSEPIGIQLQWTLKGEQVA
ncbi:DUF6431 domain-containing protein [Streptomyces sp. NPDC050564]|uniref:DUF6431 domain-containing protein n=1 Tax=Streptomyces sp. NPDC050564 TaxID=3365631 RepID=UPI0037A572F1